jgi:RNA polymerase sigma-70 factor (ECF subfamily)
MDRDELSNATESHLHDLIVRGIAGDATAYRAFLTALGGHLRAYYRRRLSSMPDDVEDLVQEALLAVHNQRHTYDRRRPLTAWAYAIAKYKLVDFRRAHARGGALDDPLDEDLAAFVATDHEAAEARRDLGKLLAMLPERQRLPIVCVKVEGLSISEAARAIGMSESAVKVGIHRGLKALATLMRTRR